MADPMTKTETCWGAWSDCPNAIRTLDDGGYPVMRCKATGKHPDDCRPTESATQKDQTP